MLVSLKLASKDLDLGHQIDKTDTKPLSCTRGGFTPYYIEPPRTAVRIPDLNHRFETPDCSAKRSVTFAKRQ